jgi:hypothetical protein
MAKVRLNKLSVEVARIADAASERVRSHVRESGDSDVLQLLDRISEGKCVFEERARYIDTMMEQSTRTGDSQCVAELQKMQEEFALDIQKFKFWAETTFEFLAKVSV